MNGNTFVEFFLRTPLQALMGDTMLITVTGRKTGKLYTTPVGFYRDCDHLWVMTSRDRTWWRNVYGGAKVKLLLHGHEEEGLAEPLLDEDAVAMHIGDYIRHIPMSAKSLGVRVENGVLNAEDVKRLARERLFVRIELCN
jgi:deazaflavin-dependent oxidoreductase (nitroreductase family)